MKITGIILVVLLGLLLVGCNALPATDQTKLVQGFTDATTALQASSGDLKAVALLLPPAQAAAATKVAMNVDRAVPVASAAATAASQPNASPVDVVTGGLGTIIPFIPPPYQQDAQLGLLAIGLIGALAKAVSNGNKATANAAVATSMQSGVTAALANGTLVAKPQAAATIDAQIIDHPTANALVDAVTNSVGVNALQGSK